MQANTIKLDRVANRVDGKSKFSQVNEWYVTGSTDRGKSYIKVFEAKTRPQVTRYANKWAKRHGLKIDQVQMLNR